MSKMPLNCQAALAYCELGLRVFPVKADKTPLTPHGFKDSTLSQVEIVAWYREWPWAGVAIETGKRSGVLFVDEDPRNGSVESMKKLADEGKVFPDTVTALTPRKGTHSGFVYPVTFEIGCGSLAPGVDVKSDGGYVCAPFSTHGWARDHGVKDPRYVWKEAHGPGKIPFAEVPEWWEPGMERSGTKPNGKNSSGQLVDSGFVVHPDRHNYLFSLAGTMRKRGMVRQAIYDALWAENQARCRPPHSEGEVWSVVDGIERYEPGDGMPRGVEKVGRGRSQVAVGKKVEAEDLADVLEKEDAPTPWAVVDLLAEGDLGIVSGPGGVGKTWVMLGMALSLASGQDVFGYYGVTRPYRVAILDLESRSWEIDQRVRRVAAGLGVNKGIAGRVKLIRERVRFEGDGEVDRLLASLKEWETDFLFVDSFRRTHGGDENNSEVVSAIFRQLDRLRSEIGCGVILNDHTRKKSGDKILDDPAEMMRGSGDKRNMVDCHFGLNEHNDRLKLTPTKTRHSRKPLAIQLELKGLEDDEGEEPVVVAYVGNVDLASDKAQDEILALLEVASPEFVRRGELIGRSRYSKRSVSDALTGLKRRKKLQWRKEGKEVLYGLK